MTQSSVNDNDVPDRSTIAAGVAGASPSPIKTKVVLSTADRAEAYRTAAAMAELIDPPAEAVAVFEIEGDGPEAAPLGWRLDAYFTELPDIAELAAGISALNGAPPPALQLEEVPDENWVAISQQALPPVTAGRFTVHGSHDRHRVPRGPHALLIDAGEAFGTAHHPTTLGCLEAIDRLTRNRAFGNVLDLGCGTGVLAIAARRALPHALIMASDIDPVAVDVTRANARQNCASRIVSLCSGRVPRVKGRGAIPRRDLFIANILARPLVALAPQIAPAVASRGNLVLSGLLTSQARQVGAAYLARGFSLVRHDRIAGWSTLTFVRR